jgi:hypothetical protein
VPSRIEGRRLPATAAAVVIATLSLAAAPLQEKSVRSNAATPSHADIERALERVEADPNLATERTIKTLRWKTSGETKPSETPAWLLWVIGLFRWIEQSARILVWGGAIALAGCLVVYIIRVLRTRTDQGRKAESFVAPTHVRDLDIRPETLPPDIGAAARALWDGGDHRASLALLYQGMLSRLAHVHDVPIRDSSTEGDCLALAVNHLPAEKCEYVLRLVRAWQRLGYGREQVQAAIAHRLCEEFASMLDPASQPRPVATRGAA